MNHDANPKSTTSDGPALSEKRVVAQSPSETNVGNEIETCDFQNQSQMRINAAND